ncbi:YtxH domain-containing protein [cf. Phormidesmis sp. LEGE 11477]|uniref:YtxH domain-containing protein n=1 Tax=cf. Phormidesmis sp. LEGE 11477 TaxID=1828680 RepID=UPI0018803054|nr:YtxH domain-containing protein [cf. Phormidesmis sp. LEGE 11477]MBE9063108.1 YtxH domain-containing protein [cf. Phormidesmis sp. LEGE 11477]
MDRQMDRQRRSRTTKQLGIWAALFILASSIITVLYVSISLPPALGQTEVNSDLLTRQLEFVLRMNTAFLGFLGITGSIAAYFFGKSFKEFQDLSKDNIQDISKAAKEKLNRVHESSAIEIQKAVEAIQQKAEREVSYLIDNEIRERVRTEVRNVQRILQRERVISSTSIDYYLPGGNPNKAPREIELLKAREFKDVQYFTKLEELRPNASDVVVLDLIHFLMKENKFAEASKEVRDSTAAPILESLLQLFPKASVLIVYVNSRPFLGGLDSDERYILAANSPITVVGNAADGAYVAKGARQAQEY